MKAHFEALKKALQAERAFEIETYRSLVDNQPMQQRIAEGVTLYPLDFTDQRYTAFDELILDFRVNPEQNGKLFGTNGKCRLFNSNNTETADATILTSREGFISIVLNTDEEPDWIKDGKIGLNAICDTRTYDLQLQALDELMEIRRGLIFDFYNNTFSGYPPDHFSEEDALNASQNKAVKSILSSAAFHAVHGPPGTGKTKTLVAAIIQLHRSGKRILVAAPTNAAADHITREIFKAGADVLRFGNSFKIDASVINLTLQSRIQNHPDLNVVARLSKEADAIRRKAFRYVRNFGPEEQAERKQLKQELRTIGKDIRAIENHIREFTLEKARIVTGTLIGLQQEELLREQFDVVLVDEAGQALEPAIWSLARHAEKLVLAGDPFQLPPTLFSPQAQQSLLNVSLIETAMKRNHPTTLLDIQYRMNDRIMQFSNEKFYGSKLQSAAQVKDQHLEQDDHATIEFIDTAGCGYEEQKDDLGGISNPEEATVLAKRLAEFQAGNYSVGVITPYRKQMLVLQETLKDTPAYVQTVDSFQGQERDIILISLVRCNDTSEIGFLKDYRRMNVAMTRARFKLVLIGDSATLGADGFYSDLLQYIETNGSYRSAYEYVES